MMPEQEVDWSPKGLVDELKSMNKTLTDLSLKDATLLYTSLYRMVKLKVTVLKITKID